MKNIIILFFSMLFVFGFFNCTNEIENPTPEIISISPTSKVAHLPQFTLIVTGLNFINDSKIIFNGMEKTTSFVSESELHCTIDPEDTFMEITSNKDSLNTEKTVTIIVRNPNPGGGDSNSSTFVIKENYSFDSPIRLFESISSGYAGPLIIDSNDSLYLTVGELKSEKGNRFYENYLSVSNDMGDTWGNLENLTKKIFFTIGYFNIDPDGNSHMVYNDFNNDYFNIYFRKKAKNNTTWDDPISLTSEDKSIYYNMFFSNFSQHNNRSIVFWNVLTRTDRLYIDFVYSGDNGNSWTSPGRIKELGEILWNDSIILKDGTIFLAFNRFKLSAKYTFSLDVYGCRSTDNGLTWSEPVLISNGAGRSAIPLIAYNETNDEIKIVWFYKKTGLLFKKTDKQLIFSHLKKYYNVITELNTNDDNKSTINETYTDPYFYLQISTSTNGGLSWGQTENIFEYKNLETVGLFVPRFNINIDKAGNLNLITAGTESLFGDVTNEKITSESNDNSYFSRSIDGGHNWTMPIQLSIESNMIASIVNSDSIGNLYLLFNKINYSRENYNIQPFLLKSITQ